MTNKDERANPRDLTMLAMSLLVGMADHADEAGLEDLGLYLTMARTELCLGPWHGAPVEVVPGGRVDFVDGVHLVLDLLDQIRPLTEDHAGVVALALARLWVVDGVRWLDRAAEKVAAGCRDAMLRRWPSWPRRSGACRSSLGSSGRKVVRRPDRS